MQHKYKYGALVITAEGRAFSYDTIIRDIDTKGCRIDNITEYSRTTSKHLAEVRRVLGTAVFSVDNVPKGATMLSRFATPLTGLK